MPARAALLAALILFSTGPARAQTAPLELSLDYDGRLYIKVLAFHFEGRIDPARYTADVDMQSSGILAAFKHFDIAATSGGRVEAGEAQPGSFNYTNHDGKRFRQVHTAWDADAVRTTSTPPFSNMGDPPASEAQKRAAADPVLQLLRITLSQNPKGPCDGERRFFDGKQLYGLDLIPMTGGELSPGASALGLINPVRCLVRYREIAGFKRKSPDRRDQGLGPTSVVFGRLGPSGPWLIASMRADTKLGPAHIDLRSAHVSGTRP